MNEEIQDLRDVIWSNKLTAEYNARYWEYLYNRYFQFQKWAEIFLAVTSSSSVAAWGIWHEVSIPWKILTALSTLVAVSLPIFNFKKLIADLGDLQSRWQMIHSEYEILWLDIEHTLTERNHAVSEIKKIMHHEAETDKIKSNVPDDKNLLEKCRKEVISANTETEEE